MLPIKVLDICFEKKNRYNNKYLDTIEESGSIYYDTLNIEASYGFDSIISRLIQEAGRFCLRYASDLFIDIREICDHIEDGTITTSSYLFGFRESGVDSDNFIVNRLYKNKYSSELYRSIWRLDINVTRDKNYKDFTGTLYEVAYKKPYYNEKEEVDEILNQLNNSNT